MIIYILEREDGDYGDRCRSIIWVGTDENKAFSKVNKMTADYNYISLWEDGKLISQYVRNCWIDERLDGSIQQYGKWERIIGAILPRLEKAKVLASIFQSASHPYKSSPLNVGPNRL
jgi:hypothetical protein